MPFRRGRYENEAPINHEERLIFLGNLERKIRKQLGTGRRHLAATFWLVRDLLRVLRWRMAAIGIFGLTSVACKFLAAGMLYLFVDALTADDNTKAFIPAFGPFDGLQVDMQTFFIYGVIVATGLLMLATAMQFSIRRAAAISAALFEERCVRRVLAAASRLPHPAIQMNGEMVKRGDLLSILAGARSCNMIARQVVQLTPSMISLVASLVILVVIDPVLTLTIMAAFLGVVILQYPMTNRSVRASDASEIDRRAVMSDMRGFITKLGSVSARIDDNHGALDRLFGRGSAFQQDIKTFTRRIDGMILGDLTARIGNHAILAGLFIFVGSQILSGQQAWAAFAAYVAIARFCMKDFQTVGKIMGQIGRLFMPVERYMNFIRSAASAPAKNHQEPVTLNLKDGAERSVPIKLEPHMHFLVLVPKTANGDFSEIYARTTGHIPPAIADDSLLDANAAMRINLALEDDIDPRRLERFVQTFLPQDRPLVWRSEWLELPPSGLPDQQSSWLIPALKAATADIHNRPGIAVQALQLKTFMDEAKTWLEPCQNQLNGGPVMIIAAHPRHFPQELQGPVIIADGNHLSWYVEHDQVDDILNRIQQRSKETEADDQTNDDALMMM